jgi:hypothetical protein
MIKNNYKIIYIIFYLLSSGNSGWSGLVTNRFNDLIVYPKQLSLNEVVNIIVATNNNIPIIFEGSKQFVSNSTLDKIINHYKDKSPDCSPVWFMYVYKRLPDISEYQIFYKGIPMNARLRKGFALTVWGSLQKHESLDDYYQVISESNRGGVPYPTGKEMPFVFLRSLSDMLLTDDDVVAIYDMIPGKLPIKNISIRNNIVEVRTFKIRGHWYGIVYKLEKTSGVWLIIDSYSAKQ